MKIKRFLPSLVVLFLFTGSAAAALWLQGKKGSKDEERMRQEEEADYYEKWLKEDVVYIITEEEKAVFNKLTTPEEKEQFIEQFWIRRDPDLSTAVNEFKEEHYRRIAYANERFASGIPGWMTDRGRIYIIHGPPAEIESHPSGGYYERPIHEGGGSTATFPFEVWRYRHVEGIGSDIELEFVDPTFSGEYRLALRPEEKDALLHVPGAGLTLAEELGMATKADRPYFSPGNRENYPMMYQRAKDNPFIRYETYSMIQRPKEIKYKDLKELVEVNISYQPLPMKVRQDYFKLNDDQVLVPVTIQVDNKDLSFEKEGDVHIARLAVYGLVTSITNRIVKEFEDDLMVSYQPEFFQEGLLKRSMYQKILPLDRKMRYKLDLVVKDVKSGKVGVIRQAIVPPSYSQELTQSSMILSDFIRPLGEIPKEDQMFVLGDVWIRPSMTKEFPADGPLGVYLQVYNAALDQSSYSPALSVRYRVLKDGEPVTETVDESGESIQFFSGQRVVLIKQLLLKGFSPGKYSMEVEVHDRISDQRIHARDQFEVVEPVQVAQNR